MNAREIFTVSVSAGDQRKISSCAHSSFRTNAKASAKVGWLLWYQATCRRVPAACVIWRWANNVTSENKLNSTGVVRLIAISQRYS
jgi:hypothetical protein